MKYGWMVYPKKSLYSKYGNNAFDWMRESALKNGIHIDIVFIDDLVILSDSMVEFVEGKKLRLPDFVIMRCYSYTLSMQLENLGIRVINTTNSMMSSKDKSVTSQLLAKNNVPTPKFLFTKSKDYEQIHDYFNNKRFVMKKNDGSHGIGVYLIENENDYNQAFAEINGLYFCQEFIDSSYGKDIRSYVLGDKVIGCVKRISDDSFKSNYSLGGRPESYELNDAIREISLRAAKALGLEFCGIDLLFMPDDSYTVCEVNGNAGFRTINQVSDLDVPMELYRWVRENIYK